MGETLTETTANSAPVTPGDEHSQADLHEIGRMVAEMHAEFTKWKPFIDRLINNPAARWKARRDQP